MKEIFLRFYQYGRQKAAQIHFSVYVFLLLGYMNYLRYVIPSTGHPDGKGWYFSPYLPDYVLVWFQKLGLFLSKDDLTIYELIVYTVVLLFVVLMIRYLIKKKWELAFLQFLLLLTLHHAHFIAYLYAISPHW